MLKNNVSNKKIRRDKNFSVSVAIIAATVSILAIGSTTTYPVQAQVYQSMTPYSDGSCADGWFQTPVGTCCPIGTMNIHNYCSTEQR